MCLKLSVIICTYNRSHMLAHALGSLLRQSASPSSLEIIVVDNNSNDDTVFVAKKYLSGFLHSQFLHEEKQGLSHARNLGWQAARGKYVAFLDDDAKASEEWCERILKAFESIVSEPSAVGGDILPWYEATPPRWFSDDMEIRTWAGPKRFLEPHEAKYGFWGSNMTFPRSVLADNAGFSTEFGMLGDEVRMGEDTEFFGRLYQKSALLWYDPTITVLHWVPKDKLRIKYRFMRKFRTGQAQSSMASVEQGPGIIMVLSSLSKVLTLLFLPTLGGRKAFVRNLEQLGFRLGRLLGG